MTKLGLVRMIGGELVGVQYFESKFPRELNEVLTIDGKKWIVAVIGSNRNSIVRKLNEYVKIQNKRNRLKK